MRFVFPSRGYDRAVSHLLGLLAGRMAPERLLSAESLYREREPDLAVEAAANMAVEDQVPLTAELAELLIDLLAPTEWADHVDPSAVRALVRPSGSPGSASTPRGGR